MRRLLPSLLVSLIWLSLLPQFAEADSLPPRLEIQLEEPIRSLPPDFCGLSFETRLVLPDENGQHYFSPDHTALVAMFQTLGIKSLRIGGNTAERASVPIPGFADIDQLFAFARKAGTKVIYTVRMAGNEPTAAAAIVDFIDRHHRDTVACYIIGNEPDKDWTYEGYLSEWKRFAAVITAPEHTPHAQFCAPTTTSGAPGWPALMVRDLRGTKLLAMAGQHYYAGGSRRKHPDFQSARETLLHDDAPARYASFAAKFLPEVLTAGIPLRMNETNSFSSGGYWGASDTFAASLWGLEYLYWWAYAGAAGINFHAGHKVYPGDEIVRRNVYTPLTPTADGVVALPLAYAIKMFSLGSQGALLPFAWTEAEPPSRLSCAAVRGNDRHIYLTLVNKTHGNAARDLSLALDSGRFQAEAEILQLQTLGDRIGNVHGVTINGMQIAEDASLTANWWPVTLATQHPHLIVTVPKTSAVLLRLRSVLETY